MKINLDLPVLVLFLAILNQSFGQKAAQLPALNVYEKRITLSGFSSGGAFAQMYQFSHSSQIHGIAVFTHTFYRCGPPTGKVDDYDRVCTKLFNLTDAELYNPERVHTDIKEYSSKGYIDNPDNLRNKRLYVYAGLRNFLFTPGQSFGILNVYERYIKNPKRIMTRVQDSQLLMPTNNNFGRACTERADNTSFIGNCGFSGAFEALNFLLGSDSDMKEPSPLYGKSRQVVIEGLKTFDQTEFISGLTNHQMDTTGFYYVPKNCVRNRKCLLHVYFHGCQVGREFAGTVHIVNSGYLEVADHNNVIMVFPQAKQSRPENDIGCWDTFGISGPLYATKRGAQIIAIKRIIDKVASGGSGNENPGSSGGVGHSKGGGGGHSKGHRHKPQRIRHSYDRFGGEY